MDAPSAVAAFPRDPVGPLRAVTTATSPAGVCVARGSGEAVVRHGTESTGLRQDRLTVLLSRAVGFLLLTACGSPDAAASALQE